MRLVCPNCDAEYEVDDAAIPRDGRDVQCSNCGHAWFQVHPEIEAVAEEEADLYDAPPGAIAEVVDEDEPVVPAAAMADEPVEVAEPLPDEVPVPEPMTAEVAESAAQEPAPDAAPTDPDEDRDDEDGETPEPPVAAVAAPPRTRSLDETVLAVLREEAEREAASRRAEATKAPAMETQTEMPLAQEPDHGGMAAAVRRIARMRGVSAEPAAPEPQPEPEPVAAPKSRGEMFPAIEEINSTLRATGDRGQDEDDAIVDTLPDLTRRQGGFRRGFVSLIVLAVLIVALYVAAPMIAEKVPALAGTAAAYVTAVDAARVWLDVNLRGLVATLRDLAGGQGG